MDNITKTFSEKEILDMSECILNTIHTMREAKKQVIGNNVQYEIDAKMEELKVLNDKLLRQIK